MIKDDNKRIVVTFNKLQIRQLENISKLLNISKSELLKLCFKNYLIDNDKKLSKRTLKICNLIKKNPHINIKYINNNYLIYTVGLEDNLKVIDLSLVISDDNKIDQLQEELNYYLLIA